MTSGLRQDAVQKAIAAPQSVCLDYETFKNNYKDTKSLCEEAGFTFTPLVFEAHGGGWSAAALRVFGQIAKQQKSAGILCKEGVSLKIAQRLSTAIHMANSRAVLKRLSTGMPSAPTVLDLEAADVDSDMD